jgi:hypothetical protein
MEIVEPKNRCQLCGNLSHDDFCFGCKPKVSFKEVCLLCRTKIRSQDPRFCDECREELGPDSDADGARFIRQLQRRLKLCRKESHWLGLIRGYCFECQELQTDWVICENCETLQSDFHICSCGLTKMDTQMLESQLMRKAPPYLAHLAIRKNDGNPIHADLDSEAWKELRKISIGASDAMKLIKQNGEKRTSYDQLLTQKKYGEDDQHFWAFDHGVKREPHIARWVQLYLPNFEMIPNRFVFGGQDLRHTATPDMIGPRALAEIKTSTKPIRQTLARYFDQLQWQMYVTEYESVLFVVENRHTQEIEYQVVYRDNERINLLVDAANELLEHL